MEKKEYCFTLTIKSDSESKFTQSMSFNPGLKGDETDLPIQNAYFLGIVLSYIANLATRNRGFEKELYAFVARHAQEEMKTRQEASHE